MEDLPSSLQLEILTRLSSSLDLASCRLTCHALHTLSYSVPSLRLVCSYARFLASRDPETRHFTTPFKTLVSNLSLILSTHGALESLFLGIERPFVPSAWGDEDFDDSNDLHLTEADFVSQWLPLICGRLRALAISDYWIQSCWRRTEALGVISACCDALENLEIRNAWLSIEGLKPMLKLTTLTLEFIRLDDEDLDKLNKCFPSLLVLNLIGVGGLKEPKIHLPELKVCDWAVSNFPHSITIQAPNLVDLKLKCVEPKVLVLKTPLLSDLDLTIKAPSGDIRLGCFPNLKSLKMESSGLRGLIQMFKVCTSVKNLELEAPERATSDESVDPINFGDLSRAFPDVEVLKVGPGAWAELEKSFTQGGMDMECVWRSLKKLVVHLPLLEPDITFVSLMVHLCPQLSDAVMIIHAGSSRFARLHIISTYTKNIPKVRWSWGKGGESG